MGLFDQLRRPPRPVVSRSDLPNRDLAATIARDPNARGQIRGALLQAPRYRDAVQATRHDWVAVGWELYERTRSPLSLGLVGLVQVVPVIALFVPAGTLVDHRDRRLISALSAAIDARMFCGASTFCTTCSPNFRSSCVASMPESLTITVTPAPL